MSTRAALPLVFTANVMGITAHMTYMYYLAPIALRDAGIVGRDPWIFAATALAMGAIVVPAGRLADRIPRRHVLRAGLFLLALAYVALLPAPRLDLLLAGTLATGFGLGLLFVSFQSYVADLLRASERGAAYGRAGALSVLASAAGPFLAALVLRAAGSTALGLRMNAALFGLATLGALLLTLRLPSMRASPVGPAERGRWYEALRAALPVSAVYVLQGAGYGMTAPYFTVFFLDHLHLANASWGYLLAAGTIAAAVGSFLAGELSKRRSPLRVALFGQLLLFTASCLFLFPVGLALLAAGFLGRSLFSSTTAPGMNAVVMSRVAPARRAEAAAYTSVGWNVGWTIGAASGGALLATLGARTFPLGGALALAGVAAGALLLSSRRP